MNKSAKEKAKKRLGLNNMNPNKPNEKDSSKKARWDFNKEYGLNFHDKNVSEIEIILNTEIFQGIQENDIIELVFPKTISNTELSLFFRVQKENFDTSKTKNNISLINCYNELVREQKINKSSVFVRLVNNFSNYYIDNITIIIKNHYLLRKDLFDIMQNMLNEPVFVHKDLKIIKGINEDISLGKVKCLTKNSKNLISGIIHSSTQFQFKSISGSLYYLVEISKETYDFSFNENQTKFETIIKFFKTTVNALKERGSIHQINIIFFTRIYFSKDIYSNLLKKFDKLPCFISFSSCGDFFFDLYTNILTINNIANINPNKIESDIINKLHKAFLLFAVGFKCRNLNSYIKNIYSEYETNFGNLKKDLFSTNPPTFSYSTIFENIDNFRIMKSNYSNFFECVNVVLKEIRLEKINLNKLGSLITVVSSGEYFPYYNKELSKFTKYNLYEIGIPLFYLIFSTKKNLYNQRRQSFKKYNTISEEYHRSTHTEYYSSLNLAKSNFYDSPITNREFREVYIYEPDQDDHLVRQWIKILYINFPFETNNYFSADNFKLFNKKLMLKDFVEIENEIFNAKKIENIQHLRKKLKNGNNNSPKINITFKGISEKLSDDFSLAVNDSFKTLDICKDQTVDTNIEQMSLKDKKNVDEKFNYTEDPNIIMNDKSNVSTCRRKSISNFNIEEIKDKLCNYTRKPPLPEKDQSFVILTNEYDRETFNYKKLMPSNNSQLNLKSTEEQCLNQRVN